MEIAGINHSGDEVFVHFLANDLQPLLQCPWFRSGSHNMKYKVLFCLLDCFT